MTLKFLQLNMFKGRYIKSIIDFIEKEDFDIINLQEVSGGRSSYKEIDCFSILKKELGYDGEFGISWKDKNDPAAYFGNATLFKKQYKLLKSELLWLKDYWEIDPKKVALKNRPISSLFVLLEIFGKQIWIINAHLVWGPNPKDTQYKLEQGQALFNHVKKIPSSFILSGDFNVSLDSKIVSWFSKIGRNLIAEHAIQNTLNPNTHRAQQLFPQGVAVDYIFPSSAIKVKSFRLVDEVDLSDHFGLLMEFEV